MTAGTKISLALGVLLVVALVAYYASLRPDATDAQVIVDHDDRSAVPREDSVPDPEPQVVPPIQQERTQQREPEPAQQEQAPATSIEQAPTGEAGQGRFLADSVGRALSPPSPAESESDRPVRPSLGDREPVSITDTVGSGGKDAPTPSEPEAPDPASGDEQHEEAEEADPVEEEEADDSEPEPEQPQRPELPEPPPHTDYTVASGDTLSSIAREWFGDESKWDLIARANPLVDPNRLRVGQVLRLPPRDTERDESEQAAGSQQTTYIVRSGDNLSRIARTYYGDESRWRMIYEANRELLRNNPDNLRVGMRLVSPPAPAPAEE